MNARRTNTSQLPTSFRLSYATLHGCRTHRRVSILLSVEASALSYSRLLSTIGSSSAKMVEIATFEEIKDLPNHPEKLLIDVREPNELVETGKIPTSVNIPRKLGSAAHPSDGSIRHA